MAQVVISCTTGDSKRRRGSRLAQSKRMRNEPALEMHDRDAGTRPGRNGRIDHMSMSKDLLRFLNDVLLEKFEIQGDAAESTEEILKRYPNLLPEEAAAIVARSDAQLIGLGVPYTSRSCWFTCGVSCARTT